MKIAEDVYKISGDGSVYLILKPVPTLVDTSAPAERGKIKSEIEKIIPLEKMEIVLLTHLHYDHAGNVDLFPNAEFYAGAEDVEDFKKNRREFFFHEISEEAKNVLGKLKGLPSEISGLKVIKVPGHTRGSVAFLDEKRGLLFSGDTLFNHGIGRTDFENAVPEKMDESVGKLTEMMRSGELKLCPGHDY